MPRVLAASPSKPRVVSIGPVTSEAAREAGLTVDVEAERHEIDGLVEVPLEDPSRLRSRGQRLPPLGLDRRRPRLYAGWKAVNKGEE